MNEQEKEIFERLTAAESSVKSLNKRVDRHDRLIESIQEMVAEVKNMREDMNKIASKVTALEEKPAKRWEAVIAAILSAIAGGLGTYLITQIIGG